MTMNAVKMSVLLHTSTTYSAIEVGVSDPYRMKANTPKHTSPQPDRPIRLTSRCGSGALGRAR
jgi:hypothetical protein